MESKKLLFIVNPVSGVKSKKTAIELLKSNLDDHISYTVVETVRANHASELANQAIVDGFDAVIAVGGDGTVNEVGKALVNSGFALGNAIGNSPKKITRKHPWHIPWRTNCLICQSPVFQRCCQTNVPKHQ